ncbi:MAG: MlaD family protein [Kofleriaceae bacterium]|nr:MlaD family protein [Kofleriaceae bacterium]
MKVQRARALRVGAFAVMACALFVLALVLFTGLQLWNHRIRYQIVFDESVYGLETGARVYFNGIAVGAVTELGVPPEDPRLARVVIEVDEATPVTSDTIAVLRYAGITGLKVIDLSNTSATASPLAPGARITARQSALDRFTDEAERLLEESTRMLAQINELAASGAQVVDNLVQLTSREEAGRVLEDARRVLASLSAAGSKLEAVIGEAGPRLNAAMKSLDEAATRAAALLDSPNARGVLADLRKASRDLKEFAREVRQRPSRLLLSQPQPERKLP